jgi:predicted nucleic acid-binding protein
VSGTVAYLDSSAVVKLIVEEVDSPALRAWLAGRPTRSSVALVRTEVARAVRGLGPEVMSKARTAVQDLDLIPIDDSVLDAAAMLDAGALRSRDAIHLAAAQSLGDDLLAIVTYDAGMLEGARLLGLPTERPGLSTAPASREADGSVT